MRVTDVPEGVVMRDHRGKTIALLPPRSEERKQAQAVRRLREQGATMRQISSGSGLSVATLRRMLTRLVITEMVEAGTFDEEIRRVAVGGGVPRQVHPELRYAHAS